MSGPVSSRLAWACGWVASFCRSVRAGGRDGDLRRDPRAVAIETNAGGRPVRRGRGASAKRRGGPLAGRAGRAVTVLS